MKNTLKLLAFVLILTMILSCKKKLASTDTELVGTWSNNDDTEIQINANGKGYSHYNDGMVSKNLDGKFKIEDETITYKVFGVKESYKIDKRPYTGKSGAKLMDLNGDVFFLQ